MDDFTTQYNGLWESSLDSFAASLAYFSEKNQWQRIGDHGLQFTIVTGKLTPVELDQDVIGTMAKWAMVANGQPCGVILARETPAGVRVDMYCVNLVGADEYMSLLIDHLIEDGFKASKINLSDVERIIATSGHSERVKRLMREIAKLHDQGLTQTQIARQVGREPRTVQRYLQEMKLTGK